MAGKTITIVGGGPAGLMAADRLSSCGHRVTVYDAMPSVGRKFLLAGKTGLNLTHSENHALFITRFGPAQTPLSRALNGFTPHDMRQFAFELGTETFVGSSGRVFPVAMKASPLLRAWLKRLAEQGVTIRTRHLWTGFAGDELQFSTPEGHLSVRSDAALLALGGASWPRLGSDGRWTALLAERGVSIAPLRPANCGFDRDWSDAFRDHFAGQPIKAVNAKSRCGTISGEFVITRTGIEGSLVYAHAAALRDDLEQGGTARLILDLAPQRSLERLQADLDRQDRKASFSNRLRKAAGMEGVKLALLREIEPAANRFSSVDLAGLIKALPLDLLRPRPIAEAISSAGGVEWQAVNDDYMLTALPGLFVAGEMLDWEAPTGGYLLTACFATGLAAACGIEHWLDSPGDAISKHSTALS